MYVFCSVYRTVCGSYITLIPFWDNTSIGKPLVLPVSYQAKVTLAVNGYYIKTLHSSQKSLDFFVLVYLSVCMSREMLIHYSVGTKVVWLSLSATSLIYL